MTETQHTPKVATVTMITVSVAQHTHNITLHEASVLQSDLSDALSVATAAVSIRPILAAVSNVFGVDPMRIMGRPRDERTARARQLCMFLTRDLLGLTLSQIGTLFGGRDHGTVLHADRVIRNLMDAYPEWVVRVQSLQASLRPVVKCEPPTRMPANEKGQR